MAQSTTPSESQFQPNQKARVPFAGISEEVLGFRERPSFVQWLGGRLASRVLWFVCAMVVAFSGAWWLTRPCLTEVQNILGSSADPKDVVEILRELQRDHFDQFQGLFQLLVLSALVPLFTLLAGYAFGTRQMEKQPGMEEEEEQE